MRGGGGIDVADGQQREEMHEWGRISLVYIGREVRGEKFGVHWMGSDVRGWVVFSVHWMGSEGGDKKTLAPVQSTRGGQ